MFHKYARCLILMMLCGVAPVKADTWYVDASRTDDSGDGTGWSTAKQTIQAAVECAEAGDTVWVTNGVYATGGRAATPFDTHTNRVCITKAVTVQSVNGPAVTVIDGQQNTRCVYMEKASVLKGFSVQNGTTPTNGYWTKQAGGGIWMGDDAQAVDCLITDNTAVYGGGVYNGTLVRCVLSGNSAVYGGGAHDSLLNNCMVFDNDATLRGGGTYDAVLYNCTLTDNAAGISGGGADYSVLYNSIVYYNSAPAGANYLKSSCTNCCTTPLPEGTGNITNAPGISSLDEAWLLQASPCVNAGNNAFVNGATDIHGNARTNDSLVDMGCVELDESMTTGELSVALSAADGLKVLVGHPMEFHATCSGRPVSITWDFDDGSVVSNRLSVMHVFNEPRTYTVQVQASNEVHVSSSSLSIQGYSPLGRIKYVRADGSDLASGTSWTYAKQTIQAAIDACVEAGDTVLVSNGVYAAGNTLVAGQSTRVSIGRQVTVQSVNGPEVTTINGLGLARCVYMAEGAKLVGFTLTDGIADDGAGLYAVGERAVVSNCQIVGNLACQHGGGALGGTLRNCRVSSNTADFGGGVYGSTVQACILEGNQAEYF